VRTNSKACYVADYLKPFYL